MADKKRMKVKREAAPALEPTRSERKKEAKQRLSKGVKIVLVAIGCFAMLLSVSAMACSGVLNQVAEEDGYHLTGGVAGTVNGTNITEDTVTKQVMNYRTAMGYSDDAAWAQYLVDNGYTPASYREMTINSLAQNYLMSKAVTDNNATVSDDELEQAWQEAAESYGGEESFESMISAMGYTKDTYKENMLRSSLEQQKLKEAVAPEQEPSDDEVVAYLNENLDTYNDARRSSHILFAVDSDADDAADAEARQKAQEVLDQINAGTLSFEDAAKEYSDDGSGEDGGDVGWDKLTQFVTEYQDALSQLSKGQVSGLVRSTYGYHIIECTDVFDVDGEVESIDAVPTEIRDYIANVLKTQSSSTAYSEWLQSYLDGADIQINEMPEDVPYNVSLEGVEPTPEGSSDATAVTVE